MRILTLLLLASCKPFFQDLTYIFEIKNENYVCDRKWSSTEYRDCVNISTKEYYDIMYISELIPVRVKAKE
jgi:hypothetical protein